MTTTSTKTVSKLPKDARQQLEESAEIEMLRAKVRAQRLRAARELASRIQVLPDGARVFVRFNARERIQHQILIGTFTTLAFTGLMQSFSRVGLVGWIINSILGGIETLRTIHHLAAIVLALQAVYHVSDILYLWFVRREPGSMWPRLNDLKDLAKMLKFNLGVSREHPQFDRFSFEEKVEYWALLWGTLIMGITGVFQWFPLVVTALLPGVTIPIARTIHAWEALLAVLAILTWHMYHTVIKESNQSIFTGAMTEEEMQELHPLEYRRILMAAEFVRNASLKHTEEVKETKQPTEVSHEVEAVELGTMD